MLICIILLVLMSVFGVVANLSVIVCIIRNTSIRKGRNYLLIFSMTIADCLFLLIVSTQDLLKKSAKRSTSLLILENLTDNISESIEISSSGGLQAIRNILFRLFHFTAVGSLVALNADKFYYIYAPFRYERCVTRKRLCALIALIWAFSFAWTLFEHYRSFFLREEMMQLMCEVFVPIICFVIPIATSFLLSVGIFRIALKHTTALYRLAREANPCHSAERSTIYCHKLWRAIMFVLVTTLVSAMLLLPYWVTKPILYFSNDSFANHQWLSVFNDFLSINAAIDPLITIMTQKLYRNEVKSWLLGIKTKVSNLARGEHSGSQEVILPRHSKHEPLEQLSDSGASVESLDINKVLGELNRTRPLSMYDKRWTRSMRSQAPPKRVFGRQKRSQSNPTVSFDSSIYSNPSISYEYSDA